MINIDEYFHLGKRKQFGHRYNNRVPVALELNLHIMAGGNQNLSTGHIDSIIW